MSSSDKPKLKSKVVLTTDQKDTSKLLSKAQFKDLITNHTIRNYPLSKADIKKLYPDRFNIYDKITLKLNNVTPNGSYSGIGFIKFKFKELGLVALRARYNGSNASSAKIILTSDSSMFGDNSVTIDKDGTIYKNEIVATLEATNNYNDSYSLYNAFYASGFNGHSNDYWCSSGTGTADLSITLDTHFTLESVDINIDGGTYLISNLDLTLMLGNNTIIDKKRMTSSDAVYDIDYSIKVLKIKVPEYLI